MGMYYHFGTAWGVSGTFDTPGELPSSLRGLDWDELYEEPEIAHGIKLTVFRNEEIGRHVWMLVVADSKVGCNGQGQNYPHGSLPPFVGLIEPSVETKENFGQVLDTLGIKQDAGWFFYWSVS